jgi:hypothetical protein
MPPSRWLKDGVYVLQHSDRFYVGKSADIAKRIREHKAGRGAVCCPISSVRVKPITPPVVCLETQDWESWERNETLTRMYEFGIDKVRGWMFTSRDLSKAEKDHAFRQVCEKFDLCRRCGAATHFASDCGALHRVQWGTRFLCGSSYK